MYVLTFDSEKIGKKSNLYAELHWNCTADGVTHTEYNLFQYS